MLTLRCSAYEYCACVSTEIDLFTGTDNTSGNGSDFQKVSLLKKRCDERAQISDPHYKRC
jgi:hypothetical protein